MWYSTSSTITYRLWLCNSPVALRKPTRWIRSHFYERWTGTKCFWKGCSFTQNLCGLFCWQTVSYRQSGLLQFRLLSVKDPLRIPKSSTSFYSTCSTCTLDVCWNSGWFPCRRSCLSTKACYVATNGHVLGILRCGKQFVGLPGVSFYHYKIIFLIVSLVLIKIWWSKDINYRLLPLLDYFSIWKF